MFDRLRRLFGAAAGAPEPERSAQATGPRTAPVAIAPSDGHGAAPATFAKGFLPGPHALEGYGNGGFQFADMSHRGSILALPSGIYAWEAVRPEDLRMDAFGRVLAEPKGAVEHLLIGTGTRMLPLFELRDALGRAGIRAEPMATDAAARTYSILLGEKRRVAAALLAVP